jgi:hypothetical protein
MRGDSAGEHALYRAPVNRFLRAFVVENSRDHFTTW